MTSERTSIDRRTVLGTLGSGAAFALAGCAGDEEPAEPDASEESGETTPETNDDDNGDEEPELLDSPTEFPEGEECAVCNMVTAEHSAWNAQLVHGDETRAYFCSAGCLSAYHADAEEFGGPDTPVENVWVTDYETGELIDAEGAFFVRVADSSHVDDIMMMNPTPFGSRESAEAFVDELNDEHDASYGYDTDIITFDDFDMELAMLYRGRFFEEDGGDSGQDQ